jgi:phage terminase large subunit
MVKMRPAKKLPKNVNANLQDIIEYYFYNPVAFAEDMLDCKLTPQQKQLLYAVATGNKQIAIKAGRGTGKTYVVSLLIWWFLCTRFKPQVVCTAPSEPQLKNVLWAKVSDLYQKLNPIFKKQFEITDKNIYHKHYRKSWFCAARTARRENPEALQGFHADNLLFVIDEASGVPDEVFNAILGSLTQKENFCVAISNPTRLSGFFYDTFTDPDWKTLTFNGENSKLVKKSFIRKMAQYGKEHPLYLIHVRGEFPSQEDGTLIDLFTLNEAVNNTAIKPSGGVVWGCDPARFGEDETTLAIRQGQVVHKVLGKRKADTMEVAGWIISLWKDTEPLQKPATIIVDSIGIGAGVFDRLKEYFDKCKTDGENRIPKVVAVNVGERANDEERYFRLRDELWDKYKLWLEAGARIPEDRKLIAQSSSIRYKFNSDGKMVIEKKEEYRKRNPKIGSPDRADAICLTLFARKRVSVGMFFLTMK